MKAWVLPLVVCSCYSFSPRTSTHIRSVAVPFFENKTTRVGLETRVAEALAKAFLEEGDLRVAREPEADSVVRGVLVRYERRASVFDERERVTTMRVVITVDVSYHDLKRKAVVWEQKGLSVWGDYRPAPTATSPAQTEEDGEREAIRMLVREILARSIETW